MTLAQRMEEFARLREKGPFVRTEFFNEMTQRDEEFFAVVRYGELVEISKRPLDFCSGKGSTQIVDMPIESLEFFGSFIQMDDPRHARQRGIVARSFTPRQLAKVLDSVELVCTEVLDDLAEKDEADFVEVVSEPFPLLVICDMMGIPRSEFRTVLDATNVILSAGDPELLGGREDVFGAFIEAGISLTTLMNELVEYRRKNPSDDLTSALVHNDLGEEMLTPSEIASFFILLAVAGNDTTRTASTLGVSLLADHPHEKDLWLSDIEGLTAAAVEEIVRVGSPVTFMRRTATRRVELSGQEFSEGDRLILFYGAANRDPRIFSDPERFDITRQPNPHVGFGGPGPHFCLGAHLARRELSVLFRQLLRRFPGLQVTGPPVQLEAQTVPLVSGIKHLPVRVGQVAAVRP
jgi:cytochrome P450